MNVEHKVFMDQFPIVKMFIYHLRLSIFHIALTVAYCYDTWVRGIIPPASFDEPPLELFAKTLGDSMVPVVEKLLMRLRRLTLSETMTPSGLANFSGPSLAAARTVLACR
jgi:hypothetical protein